MALIICPECGKKISDQADFCPQCGFKLRPLPAWKEHFVERLIGGVIASIAIGFVISLVIPGHRVTGKSLVIYAIISCLFARFGYKR